MAKKRFPWFGVLRVLRKWKRGKVLTLAERRLLIRGQDEDINHYRTLRETVRDEERRYEEEEGCFL